MLLNCLCPGRRKFQQLMSSKYSDLAEERRGGGRSLTIQKARFWLWLRRRDTSWGSALTPPHQEVSSGSGRDICERWHQQTTLQMTSKCTGGSAAGRNAKQSRLYYKLIKHTWAPRVHLDRGRGLTYSQNNSPMRLRSSFAR